MAIAALIIVGVLLVSSTLVASLLVQRRAKRVKGDPRASGFDEHEYATRLRKGLRSRLSHELRTPLNSIITLSQLMLEDQASTLSAEQRRYLDVIRRNGRSLLAMVDHLGAGEPLDGESAPAGEDASSEVVLSQPDGPAEQPPQSSGRPHLEIARPSGRILLIEDDPIERQRIGSFIEAAGYAVTRAASGEEGLALLRSQPFAAVVLDLIMPEMSGLDVLRAARTEERLADVRFIVLSAMYMTKNERQVLGPKVADVVRKGETMPRALTFALQRTVKPAFGQPHAHHGDGGGRHL